MTKGEYSETGELRWGEWVMNGANVTVPFVSLQVGEDQILIEVNFLGILKREFPLERARKKGARKKAKRGQPRMALR